MKHRNRHRDHNPNWKGGRFLSLGYVMVLKPDHPSPNHVGGYVFEHRLVMEAHLGRYLERDEVVHHIDGNRQNNAIANLRLLTKTEHDRLHGFARRGMKYRNASSPYRGVSWYKKLRKWRAAWSGLIDGRKAWKTIGYYESEVEAARAADGYSRAMHGPDAITNF